MSRPQHRRRDGRSQCVTCASLIKSSRTVRPSRTTKGGRTSTPLTAAGPARPAAFRARGRPSSPLARQRGDKLRYSWPHPHGGNQRLPGPRHAPAPSGRRGPRWATSCLRVWRAARSSEPGDLRGGGSHFTTASPRACSRHSTALARLPLASSGPGGIGPEPGARTRPWAPLPAQPISREDSGRTVFTETPAQAPGRRGDRMPGGSLARASTGRRGPRRGSNAQVFPKRFTGAQMRGPRWRQRPISPQAGGGFRPGPMSLGDNVLKAESPARSP